jgi:hypothetical protein
MPATTRTMRPVLDAIKDTNGFIFYLLLIDDLSSVYEPPPILSVIKSHFGKRLQTIRVQYLDLAAAHAHHAALG